MQNVFAGQVVYFCQLCLPSGFFMSLRDHNLIALIPQLQSGRRMDGVVNTAVTGTKQPKRALLAAFTIASTLA